MFLCVYAYVQDCTKFLPLLESIKLIRISGTAFLSDGFLTDHHFRPMNDQKIERRDEQGVGLAFVCHTAATASALSGCKLKYTCKCNQYGQLAEGRVRLGHFSQLKTVVV